MFPPFPILLVLLAALDVVSAVHESAARLRLRAPSLHEIIKRQAGQNITTTNSTTGSSNTNATTTNAATVPLTLASDQQ